MTCHWLVAGGKSLAMASMHKCASTSLRAHSGFCDLRPASDVLTCEVRVAWLRQPILRMHSAWRGFHIRDRTQNARWGLDDESLATWENFVDHTFIHANEHWQPQVPTLYYGELFVPTVVERFENITTHFNHYLPGTLARENKSIDISVDLSYRRDELERKFMADLDLWESTT